MKVKNLNAFSDSPFSALFRGSTHAGEGRVEDNLHAHPQNGAIAARQRLGKTCMAQELEKRVLPGQPITSQNIAK